MSKAHRGRGIREQYNQGRGSCPLCKRSQIKIPYEHDVNGKKIKICKQCRAALAHGKMQEALEAIT